MGNSGSKDNEKKANAKQRAQQVGAPRPASAQPTNTSRGINNEPAGGGGNTSPRGSPIVSNNSQAASNASLTSSSSNTHVDPGNNGMPSRQTSSHPVMQPTTAASPVVASPSGQMPPPAAAGVQQGSYQDFQALKTTGAHKLTTDVVSQIAFNWTQAPIDAGGFSSIFAGKYFNTEVVVKLLAIRDKSEHDMFQEELAVLINPDFIHANLVPLIGYCMERPSLIFQRLKPMKQERMQRLPLDVREMIAIDATRGIAHMHSKGYVHRDLKPDNVLLEFDQNRHFVRALISDMGCARNIIEPIAPFGTMLFMDNRLLALMAQHQQGVIVKPECYNDVYSLALTIACILTARPAHQKQDFDMMISEIEGHDTQRGALLRSMIQDQDPLARPTAAQALVQLEALQGKPRVPRQGGHQPLFVQQPQPVPQQQQPMMPQQQHHQHHQYQQQQQVPVAGGIPPQQQAQFAPLHQQQVGNVVQVQQGVPVQQQQQQHNHKPQQNASRRL